MDLVDLRDSVTQEVQEKLSTGNTAVKTLVGYLAAINQSLGGDSGGATQAQIRDAIEAATNLDGIESSLASIHATLQGDKAISNHLFVDSTNTIYLRVVAFNQDSNAYEATVVGLNGQSYTPVGAEQPISRTDLDTTETVWEITTAATGYSIGDVISQFTFLNQFPSPSVAGVVWYNQNTAATISAPLPGHRRRIGQVSATEATLASLRDNLGLSSATPATSDTGNFSLIALFKRLISRIGSTKTFTSVVISLSGDNTIIAAPPAGQRLVISAFRVQSQSQFSIAGQIKSGTATILARVRSTAEGTGLSEVYPLGSELRLGTSQALIFNQDVAQSQEISVVSWIETVATGLPL